ncbi:uncharacterized protein LOC127721471 isoform X2 [Mytilus californianus]|uniref:uncharacterized protein LOC127721471 isoform X2 n=1 Tax=Mytilus californianus TaxID=6549 RepID=UPI0022483A0D|nr:uncharacterized protein LOC127721471 isoform X2 [Mytilus californianus]
MPLKSAGRMAYKFFDGCMLGVDSTDLHSIREACRDKIIEEYSEILSLFEHMGMDNLCRAFQIEDGEIRSHNYGMTQADRLLSMIVIREGDECLSYLQKLPPKEQNILKRILRKPDLQVRLSGTTVLVRIPSFPTMQPTVHDIAAAAGEHLGRILVDQWEGSIVLRLYSETENLSSLTVHLNEDKLKRFLQKMYMCVELLPNEWKRLVVEMQFIPNDKFIEDRMSISYSGTQLHDNTERNQPCSRCLQETVRQNVQTIVDELESDIITETFNNFGNASKFVKDMCLSVKFTPSRQERALRFLNFALHEEKCLREFFNVLRRRSNVNLIQAQCLRCSTTEATHAVENMEPYNQKHAMCFYLIREEGKNVVRGDKECLGPTAGFSIRDIHRRQEYWGTTSHHMQLHGDRSFEQQETASTWEEQTGTVFYPRESSTPEFGSRRYRQSREFESNPHISYKLKKSKRRKDRRRTQ